MKKQLVDGLKQLQKFKEEELTKIVLIPLLEKMGFKDIEYCHGIDEYGRDMVFSLKEPFEDCIWWGSQVKACDIHGNSKILDGNATQLKLQIHEAFSQPYYFKKESKNIMISQIIVFTSFNFKGNSKEILKQEFNNKPVKFYDGNDIVRKLKEYKIENFLYQKNGEDVFNVIDFKKNLLKECSQNKDKFRAYNLLQIWYKKRKGLKFTEKEIEKIHNCILDCLLDEYSHFNENMILDILNENKKSQEILVKKINNLINSIKTYNHYYVEDSLKILIKVSKILDKINPKNINNEILWELLFSKIRETVARTKYDFQINSILFTFFELTDVIPKIFIEKSTNLDNKIKLMIYLKNRDIKNIQKILSIEKEALRFFINTTQEFLFIHVSNPLKYSTYDKNRSLKTIKAINEAIKEIKFKNNPNTQKWIYKLYDSKYAVLLLLVNNQQKEYNLLLKQKETYATFEFPSDKYSLIKIIKILLKKDINYLIKNIPSNLDIQELQSIIQDLYFFKKYDEIIKITDKYKNRLNKDYWGADILDYIAIANVKKGKFKEAKNIFDELKKEGSDLTWKYYDLCKKRL